MQILANGLITGLGIALLAIGFQLVYLPTRVFFIGLAGLYAVAPYVSMGSQALFGSWVIGVFVALATVVGLSLLIEWANHAPLARKGASDGAHLISSLGIYILMVQAVVMIWGNSTQTLRTGLDTTVQTGGLVLTQSQLLMAFVACALIFTFLLSLRTTDTGLRLRALADNPIQFALFGYNVDAHRLAAFGLAGLFATAAALLTAYDTGFDPHRGLHAVLLAVVAVIIGGRTSFVGPIIGGVLARVSVDKWYGIFLPAGKKRSLFLPWQFFFW